MSLEEQTNTGEQGQGGQNHNGQNPINKEETRLSELLLTNSDIYLYSFSYSAYSRSHSAPLCCVVFNCVCRQLLFYSQPCFVFSHAELMLLKVLAVIANYEIPANIEK